MPSCSRSCSSCASSAPPSPILLVGAFGAKICYWLDSASFVASGSLIASLSLILPRKVPPTPVEGQPAAKETTGIARVFADMKEGIRFILHHAGLLFVILALAAGMFVIGCFGPLIAVYVRDSLHAPTRTFGIASAMIGFGMLIGVNALNRFAKKISNTTPGLLRPRRHRPRTSPCSRHPHLWSTILGDFLIGFSVAGIIVPSQTLIQQETPPELMGRVGSTFMSVIFTAQIAGLVLSGILAEHIGVRRVFALCAALLAVLIAVGNLWMEPAEHPALA